MKRQMNIDIDTELLSNFDIVCGMVSRTTYIKKMMENEICVANGDVEKDQTVYGMTNKVIKFNRIIASIIEYDTGKIQIGVTAEDKVQIAISFGEKYDIRTEFGKHWINLFRDGHWTEFCVDEFTVSKKIHRTPRQMIESGDEDE